MRLEARNVSFRYDNGNRNILNHMDLTLESGERLGLAAPSGVYLDGKPLSAYKGYCPVQMIWQHPELAVNPRLRMGTILNEGGPVEERIVRGLGIESGWLDRYPGELSGGELQRFCIARALGSGTRFLLADEITTMLDLITQSQIWQFLGEEVGRRGLGLMVVSHSQALMERLCGRILDLEQMEG